MAEFLTKHLAAVKPFVTKAASQMTESYRAMKKKGYVMKKAALFKAIRFARSNAEDTKLPDKSFDLVTVMWAFHEAPMKGRDAILKEARRLLSPGGTLAVVDISTDYVPSEQMLKGEPYVKEYQQNIQRQLQQFQGFNGAEYRTIVPHHLGMWTLTRSAIA
jgi:ubiquinone/menaquinone biosynthesis C-methylase UbiE